MENGEQRVYPKCVQINYPNEHVYTRSVEIKHVTKQKLDSSTISLEFYNLRRPLLSYSSEFIFYPL